MRKGGQGVCYEDGGLDDWMLGFRSVEVVMWRAWRGVCVCVYG